MGTSSHHEHPLHLHSEQCTPAYLALQNVSHFSYSLSPLGAYDVHGCLWACASTHHPHDLHAHNSQWTSVYLGEHHFWQAS